MKYSILASFSIAMVSLVATAEAALVPSLAPGFPKTLSACLKTGASKAACEALLLAPSHCEKYYSDDKEEWRDCLGAAEAAFHKATATGPSTAPYAGEVLPVGTREVDSDYYKLDPEHKGWRNAESQ